MSEGRDLPSLLYADDEAVAQSQCENTERWNAVTLVPTHL